ncbi:MAG: hypothetical protein ILNGONEN_02546 [Syntrophorhabdaceae bacterium]|nr:hypothetical protein [Syntrophorhabdaceae bacterium]
MQNVITKAIRILKEIDSTAISIVLETPLQLSDSRFLRGYFGIRYHNRPEFHQHGNDGLIYRHPCIQYKAIGGVGWLVGLAEGSFLLQAVEVPTHIELGYRNLKILHHVRQNSPVQIGVASTMRHYRFITPWLALNEDNYSSYLRMRSSEERTALLKRILIGNVLSFCKTLKYEVTERLSGDLKIENETPVSIKPGVELIGFLGDFEINFELPHFWGLGKQSARGFGTIQKIEE